MLGAMRLPTLFATCVGLAAPLLAVDGYEDLGRAGWGGFAVPPPLAVQAERDLVPGQGLMVVFVRPDSTADHLGIAPGDVVLALNDQPVASRRELRAVVRQANPGDEVKASLAGPGGVAAEKTGVFHERLPRRAGPPPWWMGAMMAAMLPPGGGGPGASFADPATVATAQREQLLAEAAELAAAHRQLAELQTAWRDHQASVEQMPAWYATALVTTNGISE